MGNHKLHSDTEHLLTTYYYNVNVQTLLQVIFFPSGEQMKWESSQFSVSGCMSFTGKDEISYFLRNELWKMKLNIL